MTRSAIALFLLLCTLGIGAWSFNAGRRYQENADQAQRAEELENEAEIARIKNRQGLAAGIRTEKAQAKTDAFFQKLRADYETDKRNNPGAGCVLDADSLRRWNEANAQSDSGAVSEPDDGMQQAAEAETR